MENGRKQARVKIAVSTRKELLAEYEASGLTAAEFTRQRGLNYQTFASWRRAAGGARSSLKEMATASIPKVRFAEVRVAGTPAAGGRLTVLMPDGVILQGDDVRQVARLVHALRQTEGGSC